MSLLKAIGAQNLEEVKRIALTDKFAPFERDASKQTALHIAILCENIEILRFLLTLKKIDINAQDDNGWTALHCAANAGRYDMCLELLQNRTTRVDLYNSDGNGILIFMCKIRKSPNIEFSLRNYYQCLQILASKNIELNYRNNFGESPLHYASMEGNLEAVYALCKNNANSHLKLKCYKYQLNMGLLKIIQNSSNETPLMYAVRKNQITIVRKLLESKADTTIVNTSGFTVFDFRISDELREILEEAHSVDLAIKKIVKELEVEKKRNYLSAPSMMADSSEKKKKIPKYAKIVSDDLKVYEKLNLEFYLARVSGWHCCMKKIECRDQHDANTAYTEFISFMDDINHPNVIQYLYHDKKESHIRLFNSIPSASLREFLSQRKFLLRQNNASLLLPIKELSQFALEIAEGLEFLHANDILHRHLKTSHVYIILKDKGVHRVVLNNFYLCRASDQWNVSERNLEFYEPFYSIPIDARKSLNNLKMPFSQPEIISPRSSNSAAHLTSPNNNNANAENANFVFSTQSDVWSYGIILYEVLTLSTPYSDIKSEETLIEVMKNSGPSIPSSLFSSDAEKEKYQNIIDIINVCTNPNPLQRPPIDLVANSIRMGINIKDLYGLKQRDLPSTFPSQEYRQDQYPILRAMKESTYNELKYPPLIKYLPGFSLEDPIPLGQPNPSFIQFLDRSIPYFQRELFERPHENFIGRSANNDIVIVSMELEGKFDIANNKFTYFTLVRTILEDTHLYISTETAKDRLKSLRSHPILANFKTLDRVKEANFSAALLELETNLLESTQYKFGVIYRKSGQVKEDEMFANSNPSDEFDQFLHFLGERITLKGWRKFRGGLDVGSDTTGKNSVYTCIHDNFEVIFHVSTLLPYDSVSAQQLHRKRHIGNDIVVVIFQDEGSDLFTPQYFASQFNHIFIIVEPIHVQEDLSAELPLSDSKRGKLVHTERQIFNRSLKSRVKYRVGYIYKEAIQLQSFPYLQEPCLLDPEKDHDHFIIKLINCERVAMKSKEFEKRLGGVRAMLLNDLYSKYDNQKKKRGVRII